MIPDDSKKAYDEHKLAQMKRLAALPMWEKLKWLEEAHRMVMHMQETKDKASTDVKEERH